MVWHSIENGDLPPVNADGLSDFVLVTVGKRCLPEVAQYNPQGFNCFYRGTKKRKRAFWLTNRFEPTAGEPRFWAVLELPEN